MEKLIPKLYRDYGIYVNSKKMIPLMIDGLLPVQRRILLGVHTIAKDKYVKTAEVLGYVMGHWHPHATADGTATWAVQNDFCLGEGQWGSNKGTKPIEAAASRYTKIKSNPKTEKLAFEFINDVEWVEDELKPEPIYLPTMLPFCLISKFNMFPPAFGFKTDIPTFEIKDLTKRLFYLLGKRKTKPIIYPRIDGCKILSKPDVLETLLTTGKANIKVKGIYQIDKKSHKVIVRGWSPDTNFETILKRIDKKLAEMGINQDSYVYRSSSDKDNGTMVIFEMDKLRNKDEIFGGLVKAIDFALQSSIRYEMILVDLKGNIIYTNVDDMLKCTFKHWKEAYLSNIQNKIKRYEDLLVEISYIKKIQPHITKVYSTRHNIDMMINNLSELSGVTKDNVEVILKKHKIMKLISITLDENEIKAQIKMLKESVDNVDALSVNAYVTLSQN